jgi:fluoride exporter
MGDIFMLDCIFVGMGGFVGTVLRYLVGLVPVRPVSGFPLVTLFINVAGAFAIGLIVAAAAKSGSLSPRMVLMLKVGVCGGFTTFSTFAYETASLINSGSHFAAGCYAVLSVVLSVLAVFAAQAAVA